MVLFTQNVMKNKMTQNDGILSGGYRARRGYEATFTIVASCPIVYTSLLHKQCTIFTAVLTAETHSIVYMLQNNTKKLPSTRM